MGLNGHGLKWLKAEMVTGQNSQEPLRYVTAMFLPKADTCFSHNRVLTRVLKAGDWKKLESKL